MINKLLNISVSLKKQRVRCYSDSLFFYIFLSTVSARLKYFNESNVAPSL